MNPASALATVFVDELARCGVTEAVISPGSWSTPLALAFAEHEAIRLHVRIDERSAGFLALGLAKRSRRPVPVLCTSGTAAANLHPAVLEASHAGIPLLVFTADRPPELRETGASQTVDQLKIFGAAVRAFIEVGVPERRLGSVAYWRSTISRAAARAGYWADPGPVHLNVCFRKPLIPTGATPWPEALAGRPRGAPWTQPESAALVPTNLNVPARGLVVIGEGARDGQAGLKVAAETGWPVYAEATSGWRHGPQALSAGRLLAEVEEFTASHQPEMVITLGRPTLSQALLNLCAAAPEHILVNATPQWPDPQRSITHVIPTLGTVTGTGHDPRWLASWLDADAAAVKAMETILSGSGELSELAIAGATTSTVADGSLLFVGSSMPIRDVDATMKPRIGLTVTTNRGVAGIDGAVSTAIGAALAHQEAGGGPAFALLGDLTFLHDHNGLIIGPGEPIPDLTIVVINNDGGAIFSTLDQAGIAADTFERVFGTPHHVNVAALATATHTPHVNTTSLAEFVECLKMPGQGIRIVEVRTERIRNAQHHAELKSVVERALR